MILLLLSTQYLKIQFTTTDYSISKSLLYLVLFVNHLLSLVFWISNKFVLPEIMISFISLFWCVIFVQNIYFFYCQKDSTIQSVEIELIENNGYMLLTNDSKNVTRSQINMGCYT